MSRERFKICPMCEGTIEHKVDTLRHPVRGDIPNVPHAVCQDCGEIFLGRESYRAIHASEENLSASA